MDKVFSSLLFDLSFAEKLDWKITIQYTVFKISSVHINVLLGEGGCYKRRLYKIYDNPQIPGS